MFYMMRNFNRKFSWGKNKPDATSCWCLLFLVCVIHLHSTHVESTVKEKEEFFDNVHLICGISLLPNVLYPKASSELFFSKKAFEREKFQKQIFSFLLILFELNYSTFYNLELESSFSAERAVVGMFDAKTVSPTAGKHRKVKVSLINERNDKRSFINLLIRCILTQFEIFQFPPQRINLVRCCCCIENKWKFVTHHTATRTWDAERFFIVINGVG